MTITTPTTLDLATIGWAEELSLGSNDPRETALALALTTVEIAIERGVAPRSESDKIVIGERRTAEVDHREFACGPILVELEPACDTIERATELVRRAQLASLEHPGWEPIYLSLMRGVCE